MLRKTIDCESAETSQENFYDGVSFSKVASLQCSDCNFAIKRTHHRLFLEYVQKKEYLKKNKKRKSLFFRKKSIVDYRLSCSPVVNKLQILPKSRARVRSSCRNAESSNIITGKAPWWRLFKFSAYLCNFIKRITPQRFCYMSSAWQLFLNYQEIFCEISLLNIS